MSLERKIMLAQILPRRKASKNYTGVRHPAFFTLMNIRNYVAEYESFHDSGT